MLPRRRFQGSGSVQNGFVSGHGFSGAAPAQKARTALAAHQRAAIRSGRAVHPAAQVIRRGRAVHPAAQVIEVEERPFRAALSRRKKPGFSPGSRFFLDSSFPRPLNPCPDTDPLSNFTSADPTVSEYRRHRPVIISISCSGLGACGLISQRSSFFCSQRRWQAPQAAPPGLER